METGKTVYIRILPDYFHLPKETKKQRNESNKIWEALFDEYLKVFGLSKASEKIIRMERKIALLQYDMIERQDYGMSAAINMEKRKLKDFMDLQGKGGTIEETVAHLEQHKKTTIDIFKCSVKMFYTYVNMMNADAEVTKKKNLVKTLRKNG